MATSGEGEFELVLGNKQLLSVFFLVILLLGVFFTMGYVVGKNSTPVEAAGRAGSTSDVAVTTANATVEDGPRSAVRHLGASDGQNAQVSSIATQQTGPRDSAAASTVGDSRAEDPGTPAISTPVPGETYLQVLAVARPEAEVLAEVLIKKGFRAVVAPGPNEKLFRVLVGPASDTAQLGRLKGDLELAGFKGAFPKKY